ncbi:MAG: PAS domain S-box protein [Promethearchaeota archaeon]
MSVNYKEKYQFLINNILETIAEIDLTSKIIYISPQVYDAFGYKIDELIGLKALNFIHPEDISRIKEIIEIKIKIRDIIFTNLRVRHKNGHYISVSAIGSLVKVNGNDRIIGIVKKITQRKKVEKLKESEEKYRNIIENAKEGYFEVDLKGNFTFFNDAFCELLGFISEEIRGRSYKSIMTEENSKRIFKVFNKVFNTGIPCKSFQYQIFRKDGKATYGESSVYLRYDSDGNKIGFSGFMRDITEKREADLKLKESEEKYRNIIENIKEGYFEVDLKGNFTFYNDALSEMSGYNREKIIGTNFRNYMTEENVKRTFKVFNNVYNTGIPYKNFQYEFLRKDGKTVYGESSVYLKYDSNGSKIGFSGFMRDVTEKRESELRLKESEEKYRFITENVSDLITILNQKFEHEFINEYPHLKVLGYSKEDLINKPAVTTIHPEDIKKSSKALASAFINGEGTAEFRIRHKKGYYIWVELKINPFIDKDGEKKVIMLGRDITEHKRMEEKLNEINKLKTELMRRTSHELKTPLISIKGFADLLLKIHSEKFDDEIISIIEEIKEGCVRLESLISEILESSQLDTDQIKLKLARGDLSFLIKFCVKELKMLLKMRNQTILLNIHDKLITKFEKERIYEVLSNLITNAIKYSPPNSEIIIKTEIKNNFIVISVEDNGIGLTEDEKKKIFKQFGKVERFGQKWDIESEGTGLGLYISKKIVELHGGKIWVESEGRNKGSTFYFSIPINID